MNLNKLFHKKHFTNPTVLLLRAARIINTKNYNKECEQRLNNNIALEK